jgi:hypothetical protein
MPSSIENDAFDPSSRRLCPDEACVGVLDAAGVCPVCGKRGEPAPLGGPGGSEPAGAVEGTGDGTESAGFADSADSPDSAAPTGPSGGEGFDALRPLCPDGTCLGVLGPNGRCNVCGRSAS